MPLIESNHLLQTFRKRLDEATQVDIAVAWATSCDALEALVDSAGRGTNIRIAVGISGNITNPTTLQRLHQQSSTSLRVVPLSLQPGIFHPKYFRFHSPNRTICWIGSANLTRGGFGENYELVHEFEDSSGEGQRWFESLWNTLDPDPRPEIDKYEQNYQPPKRDPQPRPPGRQPDWVPLADQSTWDDFVEQLKALDDYWDWWSDGKWNVLGDTHSWLHTISTGREVARLSDWTNLTERECCILLGRDQDEEDWALLGSLTGAGKVAKVFNPKRISDVGPVRTKLREHMNQVLNLGDHFEVAKNAQAAVRAITKNKTEFPGFGPAAITRFLTLARPDCLVSVNKQSAEGLARLPGLPKTSAGLANRYFDLLSWVYEQPWFKAPQPNDPLERTIWNSRTALLDAFVYEGNDV